MQYRLVRSQRKTLSIRITPDAEIEVRAPQRLSLHTIEAFLETKRPWIEQHLAEVTERVRKRAAYQPTDSLPFLGQAYPITFAADASVAFTGTAFCIPNGSFEAVKPAIEALYRSLAKSYLTQQVSVWAQRMDVVPTGVHITNARGRWGSCSGKNSLNFSWRLILGAPDAVEYVVVHELAHIRQHNHSPAFWAEVGAHLPDYMQRRILLRHLEEELLAQGW